MARCSAADNATLVAALAEVLRHDYGCHTAILYGSRARGDWEPDSDLDVLGFRDTDAPIRLPTDWQGLYVDGWIDATAARPNASWVRLKGGRVLFQRERFGEQVLARVEELVAEQTVALSTDERLHRQQWARRMLRRAARDDAEGHYRLHWLLFSLLEDYFAVRGLYYPGPKAAFALLRQSAPEHFHGFDRAMAMRGSLTELTDLVSLIYDPSTGIEQS